MKPEKECFYCTSHTPELQGFMRCDDPCDEIANGEGLDYIEGYPQMYWPQLKRKHCPNFRKEGQGPMRRSGEVQAGAEWKHEA